MTKEKTIWDSRKALWNGIGTEIKKALSAEEALEMAELDWNVIQKDLFTEDGEKIEGFKANVKETDGTVLGIVSDKYVVVQNKDAFSFVNLLFGKGLTFETMGSMKNGRSIFMVLRFPQEYIINGERITPYIVVSNSHDTTSSLRISVCPLRVTCANMLPLVLKHSKRSWACIHAGNLDDKFELAKQTLQFAENYMGSLGEEFHELQNKQLTETKVLEIVNELIPEPEDASEQQKKNVRRLREDILYRYNFAPDLVTLKHSAYRLVNSVADHICHSKPVRETKDYQTNLFQKMAVENHPLLEKACKLSLAA